MTVVPLDVDFSALSAFVAERLGLHFPPERWHELGCGLEAACNEFGFDDTAQCARWMMSAPLEPEQINVLASYLTIGETYFFRQKELFVVLEEQILPALVRERRDKVQRLRLWSAGCCTGEEAYSLAILVRRLIPDFTRWNITLLASDINPRFLQKAQAGVFREWSFRHAPDWLKDGYFSVTQHGHYALSPEIRKMVTFFPLNLAEDTYPSMLNDTNAMDIILCRNVLMYFTPEQVGRVLERLSLALVDGGWLAVSPCEMFSVRVPGLVACESPGLTLFQAMKGPPEGDSSIAPPPGPGAELGGRGRDVRSERVEGSDYERQARALANRGRLEEALTWCDQALAVNPLDAACHYLKAGILSEQGNVAEAVRSLHRCITLAPDFVLAHFAMGNAVRPKKRHDACRHYRDALRLLRQCGPDDLVPHSEGLTAGRLTDMIASLLEIETR